MSMRDGFMRYARKLNHGCARSKAKGWAGEFLVLNSQFLIGEARRGQGDGASVYARASTRRGKIRMSVFQGLAFHVCHASIHQLQEKIHLNMTVIAYGHPACTAAQVFPGFLGAFKIKPRQLISGQSALGARFCHPQIARLSFGKRMLAL